METEIVGTPQCMAPEMILGTGYGRAVDWWAFGVIIFEMLRGESPFNGETPEQLFRDITTGRRNEESSSSPSTADASPVPVRLGTRFSDPAQDLVEGLLCRQASNRLGGTKRGGTFGLRFHAFFAHPTLPGDKDGHLANIVKSAQSNSSKAGRGNLGSINLSHYPQPVEWAKLRQRAVPPPFVVAKHARARAATNAYGTAKELGWTGEQKIAENARRKENAKIGEDDGVDNGNDQDAGPRVANGIGLLPHPASRGHSRGGGISQGGSGIRLGSTSQKRQILINNRSSSSGGRQEQGDVEDEDSEDDTEEETQLLDLDSAVFDNPVESLPGDFVPMAYPPPLLVDTPEGFNVLRPDKGMLSRTGTAMGSVSDGVSLVRAEAKQPRAARPSTSERAIPFQMRLAELQLLKTTGYVREEQAAITYGEAVNELANLQQKRLIEKELQSQALLRADESVYLSVPDIAH